MAFDRADESELWRAAHAALLSSTYTRSVAHIDA